MFMVKMNLRIIFTTKKQPLLTYVNAEDSSNDVLSICRLPRELAWAWFVLWPEHAKMRFLSRIN